MAWQYKAPKPEAMKRKAAEAGSSFRGKGYLNADLYKAYVPRDGQNKIRIVPPIEVEQLEWYGLDVGLHRNIGINKDMYLCLKYMRFGNCSICALQTKELWDEDPDLAKTYYPERRCLVWVMDLLSDKSTTELMLWSVSQGTLADLHNITTDLETGRFIDLMDPKSGVAAFFTKTGKGKQTSYAGWQLGKTPIPIPDSLLKQRTQLADLLVVPTEEEVAAAINFSPKSAWEGQEQPRDEDAPGKYQQAAGEPEQEAEAEEEASGCLLDGMSRDELKAFKVKHKGEVAELQFTIQAKWSDEELKTQLLAALAQANRMDLVAVGGGAEPEAETEGGESDTPPPADDPVARKREEVRQRLAAALAGKKAK